MEMAAHFASATVLSMVFALILAAPRDGTTCRHLPGDSGWPNSTAWSQLNQTVGGRLIATLPLGSTCHTKPFLDYNESKCEALQSAWTLTET
ncbi:hypothetical protein BKA67DRAFT_354041 [Truncatella angustata]|uniref:Uncharacterized protein n=1 Tax=Truncatella angustata TaxID=152316 RepID=A0A9P8UI12_9PEZI|nr:uncharacterized protein BKA67DRAFT_354041 [Truncatella angustata]KAH6652392.1 hypothetical protein BKA67DRAFT_354041 [Truncatella angustata]